MGAWIETIFPLLAYQKIVSHPMWVRGLKHQMCCNIDKQEQSHPMWVRGLKLVIIAKQIRSKMSHPMWVRGLKLRVTI